MYFLLLLFHFLLFLLGPRPSDGIVNLFAKAGFGEADCPNTDAFFDNMLSLPFYPWFSDEQYDHLINSLKAALDELRQA